MPSLDMPNQYKLMGEHTPMWLIMGMLLIGIMGSVTSAYLLLPPDMTIDKLGSWIIQSKFTGQIIEPPSPLVVRDDSLADLPLDKGVLAKTVDQELTEQPKEEIIQSQLAEATKVESEAEAPAVSPDKVEQPLSSTRSPQLPEPTTAEVLNETETVELAKFEEQAMPVASDTVLAPSTSKIDTGLAESPSKTSDDQAVDEMADAVQESASMIFAIPEQSTASTDEMTDKPRLETTTQVATQMPDDTNLVDLCAPLFSVQFVRGGIHPIDMKLNEKAAKLREWLRLHPGITVLVEGHADASGPEEFNLFISHRRAKVVSEILLSSGVTEKQMALRAFGEYSPLIGVPPESEKNRRVSLRIEGVRACQYAQSNGDIR
jgi:flagellar motor protein MotB